MRWALVYPNRQAPEDGVVIPLWGKYLSNMKPSKGKITVVTSTSIQRFKKRYPDFWQRACKYIVARNPYDRFISGWRYLKWKPNVLETLRHLPAGGDAYIHISRPQTAGLIVNGALDVDLILRFENLQEDFSALCGELEIPNLKLPHTHKTEHEHYSEYFCPESKELMARHFADDFKYLNYEA
jgi:hypothetical protein